MGKKIFYCENCGMTIFRNRKPVKCPRCDDVNIKRILTEDDLNKLKK